VATSEWGVTPRTSIEQQGARRGTAAVVDGCRVLLAGGHVDEALLLALGGPAAAKFLDGADHDDVYWLRVWGARGLLWAWDDSAAPDVRAALADEHWRVREMALKVVARHLVGEAVDGVVPLRDDPVARVRAAAERTLTLLTAAGA
jgi:hypothetical protein